MSAQNTLDIKGNFKDHPLAELLIETTAARLSGSFRLTKDEEKIVIYLDRGIVVFAASNLRQHRLFELLLTEKKITSEQLVSIENFVNDLELAEKLRARKILQKPDIDALVSRHIENIIRSCLSWQSGTWDFSPLIRIKESIRFKVDLNKLLLEYSRTLSANYAASRVKSNRESFGLKPSAPDNLNIESHEAFILSRFEKSFINMSEIDALSGLPEDTTRQALYRLWLGGFLFRENWDSALSEKTIARLQTAESRLRRTETTEVEEPELVSAAEAVEGETEIIPMAPAVEEAEEIPDLPEVDEEELLRIYLERIEGASNLYEVIGAFPEDDLSLIKQKYFAQAKKYHPDLFYKQSDIHPRVQNAFTELAHAYETMKSQQSRDLYDFKMRKELARLNERKAAGMTEDDEDFSRMADQAAENFEAGQELLMNGDFEDSIPYFARAVHFANGEARYHAFYGKALSSNRKQQHKAEAELQTAVRIEPENTTYRLMLAELFVHVGLFKRAEGELKRLLAIAPNDREALALLDSLQGK